MKYFPTIFILGAATIATFTLLIPESPLPMRIPQKTPGFIFWQEIGKNEFSAAISIDAIYYSSGANWQLQPPVHSEEETPEISPPTSPLFFEKYDLEDFTPRLYRYLWRSLLP